MTIWLVRAGKYGEQEQTALDKGIVIIGWNELPDLSAVNDRETLATLYKRFTRITTSTWQTRKH